MISPGSTKLQLKLKVVRTQLLNQQTNLKTISVGVVDIYSKVQRLTTNTLQVISRMSFYESNDPTNGVKALKEDRF